MPRGRLRKVRLDDDQLTKLAAKEESGTVVNPARLDKLPALVDKIDRSRERQKTANSDHGHIYKAAEEDGFHRRALKDAIRLRNMEPGPRRDYLSSLNAYCDKLGIWDQGDLFDQEPQTPTPRTYEAPVGGKAAEEMARVAEIAKNANPDFSEAFDVGLTEKELAESEAKATAEVAGYTYETGRQAGLRGDNLDDNPWPEGTKAHITWAEGWKTGQMMLAQDLGRGILTSARA